MIFALTLFVASDICASVILRRFAVQNPHSLAAAITSYIYNTATAGLYLHLIEHKSFLIFIDFEETYMNFQGLIFFSSIFMVLFHCWAFSGSAKK